MIMQSHRNEKISDIDVENRLKEILESFNDESRRQRDTSFRLSDFRSGEKGKGVDDVEEAEDDDEGLDVADAVSGAVPDSSKNKKEKSEKEETTPAGPVTQQRGAPIPSYDLMREKMNLIRSGKSLKDVDVDAEMREYFETLDDSEKLGLIAYLTGISQIVAGEVPARNVSDPSEPPYKIKMTRNKKDKERTGSGKKSQNAQKTQGTPESPIVVGEAADKSRELNLIKGLVK